MPSGGAVTFAKRVREVELPDELRDAVEPLLKAPPRKLEGAVYALVTPLFLEKRRSRPAPGCIKMQRHAS